MTTWRSGGFLDFIQRQPIPAGELAFFSQLPWALRWIEDAAYKPVSSTSRVPKDDGEDDLFAKTLCTSSTIPRWLLLAHCQLLSTADRECGPGVPSRPDLLLLLDLAQGVNGFRDTVHGGILSALLDDTLGFCVEMHRHHQGAARPPLYTANLNINFRRPVQTPGSIVVAVWLEEVDGRKWRVGGQILNSEGLVCVSAKGLWVAARSDKM